MAFVGLFEPDRDLPCHLLNSGQQVRRHGVDILDVLIGDYENVSVIPGPPRGRNKSRNSSIPKDNVVLLCPDVFVLDSFHH